MPGRVRIRAAFAPDEGKRGTNLRAAVKPLRGRGLNKFGRKFVYLGTGSKAEKVGPSARPDGETGHFFDGTGNCEGIMRPLSKTLMTMLLATAAVQAGWAGEVTGTVTFEGKAPKMKPIFAMEGNPDCARLHGGEYPRYEWLVLGPSQEMAHILVQITAGLPEGENYPVPDEPAVLSQKGCVYTPHVFVVRAGQRLVIDNPDGFLHNIKALPEVNTPFNKSTQKGHSTIDVTFDKPEGPFAFKCDVHNWMQAWCAVLDHPYFDVTDESGAFTIDELPAGDYTITFWHERLGEQSQSITVPEDGSVNLDVTFSRDK